MARNSVPSSRHSMIPSFLSWSRPVQPETPNDLGEALRLQIPIIPFTKSSGVCRRVMKRSSLTVVLRRYEKTSQTMPSLSPSHRPHRCTARIKTGDLLSCSAGGAMLASRSKQGSSLVYESRGRPGHNGSPHRYHEILVCALNLASSRKCPKAMLGEAWQPVARQAEPSPVQKHRHALGDSRSGRV